MRALLLLLISFPAFADVSLLGTPATTEGSLDPDDYTVSAGANRWLILLTCINGAGDTMDSVTYGTQSMTLIADSGEFNSRRCYIWGIAETGIAAASNAELDASYTGGPSGARVGHTVITIQDADQTTPGAGNTDSATASSTGDPIETTLPGGDGSFGVSVARQNDTPVGWTWGNSFNEELDSTSLTGNDDTSAYLAFSGAGSRTPSADPDNAGNMLMVSAQFDPLAGGVAPLHYHLENN